MKGFDVAAGARGSLGAPHASAWPYVALAIVMLFVGVVGAWWALERRLDVRRTELDTISELKAKQAQAWFTERRAGAGRSGTSTTKAELYLAWQEEGDEDAAEDLFFRLRRTAEGGTFEHVALYHPSGRVLWRSDPSQPVVGDVVAPDDRSPDTGPIVRTGTPYVGPDGELHVDFVVRLPVERPRPAPLVAYTAGAYELMSDALRAWPTTAVSGTVVLVHAAGRELWAVAADAGTRDPRTLHVEADGVPRDSLFAPLARELDVGDGTTRLAGLDDRGVPSYAAVAPLDVPGWALVAKLDRSEVLRSELVPIIAVTSLLVAALIAAGWLGLTVVRQRQRQAIERERRRLERHHHRNLHLLGAIAEASTDAIYAKSVDGRYLFANPATHDLLGQDRDALVGRTEYDVFDEAHAERLRAIDRRVLEHDRVAPFEDHVDTPRGHRVFWVIKGRLQDRDGETLGVFGISRDVTEQKEVERELEKQRRALEASVAELERFNRILVDRELRMVELKREVNALRERLGEAPLYDLHRLDAGAGSDDA